MADAADTQKVNVNTTEENSSCSNKVAAKSVKQLQEDVVDALVPDLKNVSIGRLDILIIILLYFFINVI